MKLKAMDGWQNFTLTFQKYLEKKSSSSMVFLKKQFKTFNKYKVTGINLYFGYNGIIESETRDKDGSLF